jgi:hypothetical protein
MHAAYADQPKHRRAGSFIYQPTRRRHQRRSGTPHQTSLTCLPGSRVAVRHLALPTTSTAMSPSTPSPKARISPSI